MLTRTRKDRTENNNTVYCYTPNAYQGTFCVWRIKQSSYKPRRGLKYMVMSVIHRRLWWSTVEDCCLRTLFIGNLDVPDKSTETAEMSHILWVLFTNMSKFPHTQKVQWILLKTNGVRKLNLFLTVCFVWFWCL